MRRRSAAKKSPQPRLPDEIWETVFSYISHRQLRSVRLVSQKWNNIVRNSSKLLDKLKLSIPPGCTAKQVRKVATTRYRNVTAWNLTAEIASLLQHFSVRRLTLKLPWISAAAMVRMLSGLSVVELRLYTSNQFNYLLFDPIPTGHSLTSLESLHLDLGQKDEFLRLFQGMCPNLKRLRLKAEMKRYLGMQYGAKLLEFIESTSLALKELVFEGIDFCHESLFRDIITVEGLELTVLSLLTCKINNQPTDYDIMEIVESQTSIETLMLPSTCIVGNAILTRIGMYLPNLTTLNVAVKFVDFVHVLSNMPQLQSLEMLYHSSTNDPLDLSGYANSQLHTLVLIGFYLDSITLLACFKKCPNIRKLWIKLCHTISVHDILVIAGQLEELHDLAVKRCDCAPWPDKFGEYSLRPFRKLRLLNVIGEPTWQLVCALLEHCPVLYSLILSSSIFDDANMAVLINFMENVTSLCLVNLPFITVLTAERVVQQCSKLELLRIRFCSAIPRFVPR